MFMLIKYMLGKFYMNCVYIGGEVFLMLSISLLFPKESFKTAGKKDFSMEQLSIDSYMLLCKQKKSISSNW